MAVPHAQAVTGVLGTAPLQMPVGSTVVSCSPASSPTSAHSPAYTTTGSAYTVVSPQYTVVSPSVTSAAGSPVPYAPYTSAPRVVQGAAMGGHPAPAQAFHGKTGPWVTPEVAVDPKAKELWSKIAAQGKGTASLSELRAAAESDSEVAAFVERCGVSNGAKPAGAEAPEAGRDAASRAFEAMAEGKEAVDFHGFEAQWRLFSILDALPAPGAPRTSKKVFIISAGFGRLLRPMQTKLVEAAGFQVHWCTKPPNPETPNFPVGPHLQQIKAELDEFKPDLVVSASKGGVYVVGLWEAGLWLGPTLMINQHPTCKRLPKGTPVVIAAGAADEHYPTPRAGVYQLQATGTRSHVFMYFAAGSAQRLPPGHTSRMGDRHNMDTLLGSDCLPRLMDAALCAEGPEVHMVRTYLDRITPGRLQAENALRDSLLERRVAAARQGSGERRLVPLAPESEEFRNVAAVFSAAPKEPSAYRFAVQAPPGTWERTRIASVQRVELGAAEAEAASKRFQAMQASIEDQGVKFEAPVHARWAFYHGSGAQAVGGPGLQATPQGPWGPGVYFARDAKYVADSGMCRAGDGSKTVLLCMLDSGIPCLADPNSASGALPVRKGPHRYQSAVDSLSNPELYVVQDVGAAHAAYLITFL